MSIRRDSMRGYKTPPDVQIIGARSLFLELPENRRATALRRLVHSLKEIYGDEHFPVPEFVEMLESEVEERKGPS